MEYLWGYKSSKSVAVDKFSLGNNPVTNNKGLTSEQDTVVAAAEKALTAAEKEDIARRYASKNSRGEGPSTLMGKGVNPCNWGAARIDPLELDVEAQCWVFDTWTDAQHFANVIEVHVAISAPHSSSARRDKTPHIDKKQYKAAV
jgi:hypothetical protein